MVIKKHKQFTKKYAKLNLKIQLKTDETLIKFVKNPFDRILNNHPLNWDYKGLRSINVTWDFRIIFRELSNNTYELVELIDVWTHSELY